MAQKLHFAGQILHKPSVWGMTTDQLFRWNLMIMLDKLGVTK